MRLGNSFAICNLAGLLVLGMATVAHSQCASSVQVNSITCNSPYCSDQVTQIVPTFGQFGTLWGETTVTCCSSTFPSFYNLNIGCNGSFAKLNQELTPLRLHEIAQKQDVFIASCAGEYLPAAAFPLSPAQAKTPELPLMRDQHHILTTEGRGGQ